jgi:hypothetical protein
MSNAITVRPQSAQDELILGRDSSELSSFILQVHDEMSPRLLEQLHQALGDLGIAANLVAVEPLGEFLPAHDVSIGDTAEARGDHVPAAILEANEQATREATARGEARLVQWTRDGLLVEGKHLYEAWGITRQALDKARERGDLFSVMVAGQHYYPVEAEQFSRADLAQLTRALGNISSGSKLIFIRRKHGALGDRTPAEAIDHGMLADVLRIAANWTRI